MLSTTTQQADSRAGGRFRVAVAGLGIGLLIGSLAVVSPAGAQQAEDRVKTTVDRPADRPSDRPIDRPTDRPSDRPTDHRLEVLNMHCAVADAATDDAATDAAVTDRTRIHIGCRWRAAESAHAAGYQLWRIVDRGERELVHRGGLDQLGARDVVSADAHVVRYAVVAVNEDGRRVGQSRVQRIVLRDDHGDRIRQAEVDQRRVR